MTRMEKRLEVKVPDNLYSRLKEAAYVDEKSLGELVREILDKALPQGRYSK